MRDRRRPGRVGFDVAMMTETLEHTALAPPPSTGRLNWIARITLALLTVAMLIGLGLYLYLPPPNLAKLPLDPADYFSGQGLALARAVDRGDAEAIGKLIYEKGVDPDRIFDHIGRPLVAWPVITHNPRGLALLLDAGASPNARQLSQAVDGGPAAETALVPAAAMVDPTYLTELLQHGGDANGRDARGRPLLYVAFINGHWTNVQRLIMSGADLDTTLYSHDGYDTVLSWYAKIGRFDRLYWLLEHGGDPTRRMHDLPGSRLAGTLESNEGRMPIVEDAFYAQVPEQMHDWQQACQSWLLTKGIDRPPAPPSMRMRERQRTEERAPGAIPL